LFDQGWQSTESIVISQGKKHRFSFENDFPIRVSCTRFDVDHLLLPNFHDYFEISYLYSGSAKIIVESNEYQLFPGDLVVLGSDIVHTYVPTSQKPADFIWAAFLPGAVYTPGESEIDFEYVRPFYEHQYNFLIPGSSVPPNVPELLCRMYRFMERKELHYRIQVKTCLYELLNNLLLYYDKFEIVKTINYNKRKNDIRRLQKVFDFVAGHYHERIALEQAARTVCMSKHYFCRFFKKVMGYTFFEYLSRFRIDKAKELILEDRHTVTEIAYDVGFDNLSYFYRTFKRLTNYNPREFLHNKKIS
jgi:AraC-like DNA-binding protein